MRNVKWEANSVLKDLNNMLVERLGILSSLTLSNIVLKDTNILYY